MVTGHLGDPGHRAPNHAELENSLGDGPVRTRRPVTEDPAAAAHPCRAAHVTPRAVQVNIMSHSYTIQV
jgi:hypothetical protein